MKNTKQIKQYTGKEGRRLTAFVMRFEGYGYKEISETIGMSIHTIERYFYKGGRWHDKYQDWVKDRLDDLNERVNKMFTNKALGAIQRIVNISMGHLVMTIGVDEKGEAVKAPISLKGETILKANQDILDRAGFKPPERIKFDSDAEDQAEDIMQAIEKMGIGKTKTNHESK